MFAAFDEILSSQIFTVIGVVVIDTQQKNISCAKKHRIKKYQTSGFHFLIVNIYQ